MTGWYDFSNVKSSKMLSFYLVAEAHGLIYLRPSGKNFSFAFIIHPSGPMLKNIQKQLNLIYIWTDQMAALIF